MGWTERFIPAAAAVLIAAAVPSFPCFADDPGPSSGSVSFAEGLKRASALAAAAPVSGPARKSAYEALAALSELAGDYPAAAAAWEEAAFAEKGTRSDADLLEAARCLIVAGEGEKAGGLVKAVLLTGKDEALLARARALSVVSGALSGDRDSLAALRLLAEDPRLEVERPFLLFSLWRVSGDDAAASTLASRYPASPEAAIVAGEKGSPSQVASLPEAAWLLGAGRSSSELGPTSRVAPATGGDVPPDAEAPDSGGGAGSQSGAPSTGPSAYQVGLFRDERNATAFLDRLRTAGFVPAIRHKVVSSQEYWSVVVPAGTDSGETVARLKDAGFESYPLFD